MEGPNQIDIAIEDRLNTRPRKTLGWLTPAEVFTASLASSDGYSLRLSLESALEPKEPLGVSLQEPSTVPASTVHAILVRCKINHLTNIDRVTGEPIRRYEHDHPGSMIHVDVTKFGNIPDWLGARMSASLIHEFERH
ncbi:hypothetical protein HNP11_004232 [Tsukamurella ocularis]|nr:hypothetical protein [Tsukamurella ocularis]